MNRYGSYTMSSVSNLGLSRSNLLDTMREAAGLFWLFANSIIIIIILLLLLLAVSRPLLPRNCLLVG